MIKKFFLWLAAYLLIGIGTALAAIPFLYILYLLLTPPSDNKIRHSLISAALMVVAYFVYAAGGTIQLRLENKSKSDKENTYYYFLVIIFLYTLAVLGSLVI